MFISCISNVGSVMTSSDDCHSFLIIAIIIINYSISCLRHKKAAQNKYIKEKRYRVKAAQAIY